MRNLIETLYWQGLRVKLVAELNAERNKRGCLRGGNSGLLDDGVFTGKCPRLSYLRSKGLLTETPDPSRDLMFAAGHTSEDSWDAVLSQAHSLDGYKFFREEEVPIQWTTSNGMLVTGRPDSVLGTAEGKFIHGIEHKLASSIWTAIDVLSMKPKMMHLVQAGHYSWQMGCLPWTLYYTSRVDWHPPEWKAAALPKCGEDGSDCIQYAPRSKKPKKILPFRRGFTLRWNDNGELEFLPDWASDGEWQVSIVTAERIKNYYEFVSRMETDKVLGSRPTNYTATGEEGGFNICSYCDLEELCTKIEGSKDEFGAFMEGAVLADKHVKESLLRDFGIAYSEESGYMLVAEAQ